MPKVFRRDQTRDRHEGQEQGGERERFDWNTPAACDAVG